MTFTANHRGVFLNEKPFDLTQSDIAQIVLNAKPSDDLLWEDAMKRAQEAVSSGCYVLWELDFGFASGAVSFLDSATFYSCSIAIEEFSKRLYPLFKEHSIGVLLFRGEFSPSKLFPRTLWEERFDQWRIDVQQVSYRLFAAQLFSEYLHRLISFLPDEIIPLISVETEPEVSPAEKAQLFSRERFEYIFPIAKHDEGDIALLLPLDSHLDDATLRQIDLAMKELRESGKDFRIISEAKLTEEWDEVETLIIFPHAVSTQGKRKLMGFVAAGGVVLEINAETPSRNDAK